jgi:mannose-6-phosphate isomerase-like protein (cupin superfamily)
LKNSILESFRKLGKQKENKQLFQSDKLPRLTEDSNYFSWKEFASSIQPPEDFDVYLHPIEQSDKRELFVVWAKEPIPEEVHHDLLESFLILEGTCECHIKGEDGSFRIVRLRAGDLLSLKKGETHDIVITSEQPVVAILEWWYEAA